MPRPRGGPAIKDRLKCWHCYRTFARESNRRMHVNAKHASVPGRCASPSPVDATDSGLDYAPDEPEYCSPAGGFAGSDSEDGGEEDEEEDDASGRREYHPHLTALPCDAAGQYLPPGAPPAPVDDDPRPQDLPARERVHFELADLLYRKDAMPVPTITALMHIWAADAALNYDGTSPFQSHEDLLDYIDSIPFGNAPWKCKRFTYNGERPKKNVPTWMTEEYEVWYRDPHAVFRNMLNNPDFDGEIDYVPYRDYDDQDHRRWRNLLSANWAWRQADIINDEDPSNAGAMFVPYVLGSDKTTVSVATGDNEYYPLYGSIGNVANNVRRAHRDALLPLAFLAIPKGDRQSDNDKQFLKFRRQLFHGSLAHILRTLKPAMSSPEVTRCPDGHLRRVIYGLGPYIADYPEQVLLACVGQGWCCRCTACADNLDDIFAMPRSREFTNIMIKGFKKQDIWDGYGIVHDVVPFTEDLPRADIHELLAPDLLHQIIKGTFKDHIVQWIGDYLVAVHGDKRAKEILDDIDRRLAVMPPFPGLRNFKQGRRFRQWTGDDSKALMKIYLAALRGYLPSEMLRCVAALLEFTYRARRDSITTPVLDAVSSAVQDFHELRRAFDIVRPTGYSLPRQHAMLHYRELIEEFGAPNGLCSSITESRHIKSVKQPWRRTNRFNALKQMLATNQRLEALFAARQYYQSRNLLQGSILDAAFAALHGLDDDVEEGYDSEEDGAIDDEDPDVMGKVTLPATRQYNYPRDLRRLSVHVGYPELPELVRRFLYEQLQEEDEIIADPPLVDCPDLFGNEVFLVYHSARAVFRAPSDMSGIHCARQEFIRASPNWRKGGPRYDCVFAGAGDAPGFAGLQVLRVKLFFSFTYMEQTYPCALVEWFHPVDDQPDRDTGMFIVEADMADNGEREISVVHTDTLLRAAHLLPVFDGPIPPKFSSLYTYDAFDTFFVNKYADHHSHEIAF
ncbi:hypothetical protein K523DRAFT_421984 [Schizophyllum commune Tattone D]|nr:hypothetical protein K523DRAFT_421984 [Schizophyllum commune Tattone D]